MFTSKWRTGKDRDEVEPNKEEKWQFVRKKSEGRKHRTERCKDLGGEFKCMRCGKRSKKENIPGICLGFK